MRLIEIQRQIKKRRKFRDGNYVVEVKLENPGNHNTELLRVFVKEDGKQVARGLFKQWDNNAAWQPLNISSNNFSERKSMRDIIYKAVKEAGFLL